jgi:hypothetical protein
VEHRVLDVFITQWGSPWIAHPIISFQFDHHSYVAASIDTPKDLGKEYSVVRRSFRHCESEEAHVSGKARAGNDSTDLSEQIRTDRPGFTTHTTR